MKVSLSWLRHYVELTATAEEIAHALTFLGFEVEDVVHTGLAPTPHLVVGEILTRERHPNADKLSVCTVRVAPGSDAEPRTIVCGAPNCDPGARVPVALPGAVLPGDFKIKVSKLRGVESQGMMCSARELGLGDDAQGLMLLDPAAPLGAPLHEVVGAGDVVFDLEITPNRPDALCHLGLARELAAWFNLPLRYPEIEFTSPSAAPEEATAPAAAGASALPEGVEVHAPEACPFYTAHVLQGVKIAPSPEWLQRALRSVGLRPINNVVDVTNFVLLELGQPLHAFDARKIGGGRLVVREAREGETLVTLDGKSRALRPGHLVIADAARPLVVAGIMGGADAEVDDSTRDLVLESAFFRPAGVRRTSKSLQLASDSSYRFERGVDPHGVLPAARRAIDLIRQTAGGEVVGPVYVVGSAPPSEKEIELEPDFVRRRCGFDITDADQRSSLARLEMNVVREEEDLEGGRQRWTVSIPTWRGDVERPIDLVEEVLRIHGTGRIPAARPVTGAVVSADDRVAGFLRAVGAILVPQGFLESVNLTLRPSKEIAAWAARAALDELRIANPLAEDQSHLRSSLVPGLLEVVRFNQARQNRETRFFETGRTFRERDGQVYEMVAAAFVMAQPAAARAWRQREPADFFTAKRLVQSLAEAAGLAVTDEQFRPVGPGSAGWQEGHAAEAGAFEQGFEIRTGLVQLALTRDLGIDRPVLAGFIEVLPERLRQSHPETKYKPVATFPAATRDLALVADEAVPAGTVQSALVKVVRQALGNVFGLERLELFDVYRGAGVPEGRKSLAFNLVFRASDRTLTDDEVNQVFASVQQRIEAAGYPVRR